MTRSFEAYVVQLMKLGTIKGVSSLLGVSWDMVKDIHKEALKRTYRSIEYSKLLYLGIDEFSLKKGHQYMTTILNLETGQIIYAVEGRDKKAVMPFLRKLARKAHNLKAIAMDMSGSYASAVKEILPRIDIVFDHFHVTALINKAIDSLRRGLQPPRAQNPEGLPVPAAPELREAWLKEAGGAQKPPRGQYALGYNVRHERAV
jgi:transposase